MKYSRHRLMLRILSVRFKPHNPSVGGAFERIDIRGLRHNPIHLEAVQCDWTNENHELRSAMFFAP